MSYQLSELYDADKRKKDPVLARLCEDQPIPHPLHGVEYADGVLLCGVSTCPRCTAYRAEHPQGQNADIVSLLRSLEMGSYV
jgi:hypothetical protein